LEVLPGRGIGGEHGSELEVERHLGIVALQLGHPRLAGAHALGEIRLRKMSALAKNPDRVAKGELRFDERRFDFGELEELGG
jgi:hypothetical protein